MEADKDTLQAARGAVADPTAASFAPRPVIEALLTLTGGAVPANTLVQQRETDDSTTWRALWLHASALAYVEATKAETDWDLTSRVQGGVDVLTAWLRPLRDLRQMSVVAVSEPGREFGTDWSWGVATEITFSDGLTVPLPLFGGLPNYRMQDATDLLVEAVRAAWLSQ